MEGMRCPDGDHHLEANWAPRTHPLLCRHLQHAPAQQHLQVRGGRGPASSTAGQAQGGAVCPSPAALPAAPTPFPALHTPSGASATWCWCTSGSRGWRGTPAASVSCWSACARCPVRMRSGRCVRCTCGEGCAPYCAAWALVHWGRARPGAHPGMLRNLCPPPRRPTAAARPPCSNISSSGALLPSSASEGALEPLPEPQRLEGETVKFHRCREGTWGRLQAAAAAALEASLQQAGQARGLRYVGGGQTRLTCPCPPRPPTPVCHPRVYLSSPDGVALVRELSFEVLPGRRCDIGAGAWWEGRRLGRAAAVQAVGCLWHVARGCRCCAGGTRRAEGSSTPGT